MGVSVSRKTDGVAMAKPVGITTYVDRSDKTVVQELPRGRTEFVSHSSLTRGGVHGIGAGDW